MARLATKRLGKMVLLAGGLLVWVTGCGREPFSMVRVSGKVTYEDGSPIECHRLRVIFNPQVAALDAKTHPRPGEATVNPDGTFSTVTTHKYGDGLIRGKHKVQVISLDDMERPTNAVPAVYAELSTTPLEVDVTRSGQFIELKIKKQP